MLVRLMLYRNAVLRKGTAVQQPSHNLDITKMKRSYTPRAALLNACANAGPLFALPVLLGFLLGMAGCGTPSFQHGDFDRKTEKADSIILREGDILRVTIPGAPTLNAAQQIRRDGKITLSLIGEIEAAGMTTDELERELIKQYSPQLLTKEIMVTVESSIFSVYVTGAVLRPGKVDSTRPITVLEAIMVAGGFDEIKADKKKVVVLRNNTGHTDRFTLNLKRVIEGGDSDPFFLRPSDIVYVPERFRWF